MIGAESGLGGVEQGNGSTNRRVHRALFTLRAGKYIAALQDGCERSREIRRDDARRKFSCSNRGSDRPLPMVQHGVEGIRNDCDQFQICDNPPGIPEYPAAGSGHSFICCEILRSISRCERALPPR